MVSATPEADPRPDLDAVRAAVESVLDPELPIVTIGDLGIVREVAGDGAAGVVVTLTPTYSGCPATEVIRGAVVDALSAMSVPVTVRTRLVPAWTTDWISEHGRRVLEAAGVAPPGPAAPRVAGPVPLRILASPSAPVCPRCGSPATRELSRFGATPCTALWQCTGCEEPFEHVKPI